MRMRGLEREGFFRGSRRGHSLLCRFVCGYCRMRRAEGTGRKGSRAAVHSATRRTWVWVDDYRKRKVVVSSSNTGRLISRRGLETSQSRTQTSAVSSRLSVLGRCEYVVCVCVYVCIFVCCGWNDLMRGDNQWGKNALSAFATANQKVQQGAKSANLSGKVYVILRPNCRGRSVLPSVLPLQTYVPLKREE